LRGKRFLTGRRRQIRRDAHQVWVFQEKNKMMPRGTKKGPRNRGGEGITEVKSLGGVLPVPTWGRKLFRLEGLEKKLGDGKKKQNRTALKKKKRVLLGLKKS